MEDDTSTPKLPRYEAGKWKMELDQEYEKHVKEVNNATSNIGK